jgi:hypothetical protein
MKTDFKNLNMFEAALVGWSFIGIVLVGAVMFSSLTPAKQSQVKAAFNIFDIKEGTREAMDTVNFVLDIPNQFYSQFYIAFEQVAVLPEYTFEVPKQIASDFSSAVTVVINNLSNQLQQGYEAQNQFAVVKAERSEIAYDGKVMGAMIDISDKLSSVTITETKVHPQTLKIPYKYTAPRFIKNKSKSVRVETFITRRK